VNVLRGTEKEVPIIALAALDLVRKQVNVAIRN
jgi:hypothetical protein